MYSIQAYTTLYFELLDSNQLHSSSYEETINKHGHLLGREQDVTRYIFCPEATATNYHRLEVNVKSSGCTASQTSTLGSGYQSRTHASSPDTVLQQLFPALRGLVQPLTSSVRAYVAPTAFRLWQSCAQARQNSITSGVRDTSMFPCLKRPVIDARFTRLSYDAQDLPTRHWLS